MNLASLIQKSPHWKIKQYTKYTSFITLLATFIIFGLAIIFSYSNIKKIWTNVYDLQATQTQLDDSNLIVDPFILGVQFSIENKSLIVENLDKFIIYTSTNNSIKHLEKCPQQLLDLYGDIYCYKIQNCSFAANNTIQFILSPQMVNNTNYTLYFQQISLNSLNQLQYNYDSIYYISNPQNYIVQLQIKKLQLLSFDSLLISSPKLYTTFVLTGNTNIFSYYTTGIMTLITVSGFTLTTFIKPNFLLIITTFIAYFLVFKCIFSVFLSHNNQRIIRRQVFDNVYSKSKVGENNTCLLSFKSLKLNVLSLLRLDSIARKYMDFSDAQLFLKEENRIQQLLSIQNILKQTSVLKDRLEHQNTSLNNVKMKSISNIKIMYSNITINTEYDMNKSMIKKQMERVNNIKYKKWISCFDWMDTKMGINYNYNSVRQIMIYLIGIGLIGFLFIFLGGYRTSSINSDSTQIVKYQFVNISSEFPLYFDLFDIPNGFNQIQQKNDSLFMISTNLINQDNVNLQYSVPVFYNCTADYSSNFQPRTYTFCINHTIKLQNHQNINLVKLKVNFQLMNSQSNLLFVGYFQNNDYQHQKYIQQVNYTAGQINPGFMCPKNRIEFSKYIEEKTGEQFIDAQFRNNFEVCPSKAFEASIIYSVTNKVYVQREETSNWMNFIVNIFGMGIIIVKLLQMCIINPLEQRYLENDINTNYKNMQEKIQQNQKVQKSENIKIPKPDFNLLDQIQLIKFLQQQKHFKKNPFCKKIIKPSNQ